MHDKKGIYISAQKSQLIYPMLHTLQSTENMYTHREQFEASTKAAEKVSKQR